MAIMVCQHFFLNTHFRDKIYSKWGLFPSLFQVSLLHSSAAQHFLEQILQTAKLNALFPTLSSPRGRALAQFPKFVLEDKHHSIQIFNVGAADKKFWEVKSWSDRDVSMKHVLYLMATYYTAKELSCG